MSEVKSFLRKYLGIFSRSRKPDLRTEEPPGHDSMRTTKAVEVEFTPDDPLLPYLLNAAGIVEVDKIDLDSPILQQLKESGVHITLPLISQGELIGLLNLGPRLSEQEYSTDDHRLLNHLATQAAPALRVAQLARQQQAEALELERLEQEMRVARIIQQTLLPKELPSISGWQVAAHWQPARAVSGDFYDFIEFPNGNIGLVTGDVTDKGVPAALVMATTRSILRTAAEHLVSPARVLKEVNNQLCSNIPPNMFVTCLYAILNPRSGKITFANAGHNLPYLCQQNRVDELRATGMPLGLLPNMTYEEKDFKLAPGARLLMYSDGLVESHNEQGEMFGFPRLRQLLGENTFKQGMIPYLLEQLSEFTGPGWEQEDDVTFLTLERMESVVKEPKTTRDTGGVSRDDEFRVLTEFNLPSQPGNERLAMEKVAEAVQDLGISDTRIEQLKTAVAEATMNAMEHGNHYQSELLVEIRVLCSSSRLTVWITDQGGDKDIPQTEVPDLEAKLEGLQSPRGWGLFLIQNMVDEMRVHTDKHHHSLELIVDLEGGTHEEG